MATILGANTLSSGFDVANSCMFNDNDSAYMHVTRGSAGNQRTFTISMWIKRVALGGGSSTVYFFSSGPDNNNSFSMHFTSTAQLEVWEYKSSAYQFRLKPKYQFRDVSAWYHVVVAVDTTQGTDTNRVKFYINGTQYTEFDTTNWPSENYDTYVNDDAKHWLGKYTDQSAYYDGYLAEVVVLDGTAASPTSFGEFDSNSPNVWKPIDVSGLTFGTNGFYLDFEDSSNLGNDANGGTDFTEANLATTDQTTDTPTNNFATLNPLENYHAGGTFAEGNTYYTSVSSKHDFAISTMAMPAGKWYAEFKIHQDTDYNIVGITDHGYQGSNQELSEDNYSYGFANYDASKSIVRGNGSTTIDNMPLFGNGDIIGVAVDITNSKLYFSKNGTFINSGDPTSGSTGTGAQSIQDLSSGSGTSYGQDVYFFGVGLWNTSAAGNYSANFGNAPFSISSGNSDANGYGNFEYAVPSGYYALCTKNLAEYGG